MYPVMQSDLLTQFSACLLTLTLNTLADLGSAHGLQLFNFLTFTQQLYKP